MCNCIKCTSAYFMNGQSEDAALACTWGSGHLSRVQISRTPSKSSRIFRLCGSFATWPRANTVFSSSFGFVPERRATSGGKPPFTLKAIRLLGDRQHSAIAPTMLVSTYKLNSIINHAKMIFCFLQLGKHINCKKCAFFLLSVSQWTYLFFKPKYFWVTKRTIYRN